MPRQARRMTLLMYLSNRNAQIPTHRLDVDFHSNVGLSNVCIASATPRCPWPNDNTSSVVNIRCSATLTGITVFSLARSAHSPTMDVRSSRSKASCTLRITQRGSMESTCLTNARLRWPLFYTMTVSISAVIVVDRSLVAAVTSHSWYHGRLGASM